MRAREAGTVGVMVTASHNPPPDNGIKIVEPNGCMLLPSWELIAEQVVNSVSPANEVLKHTSSFKSTKLQDYFLPLLIRSKMSYTVRQLLMPKPHVFIARDTRDSSPKLVAAIKRGLDCLNVPYTDFGLLTTPQLHYVTAHHKKEYTEECYIKHMTDAYIDFVELCNSTGMSDYTPQLVLDCANGVGAVSMKKIQHILGPYLKLILINTKIENSS